MNRALEKEIYSGNAVAVAGGNSSMKIADILFELVRIRCYWQYQKSDSSIKKEAKYSPYRALPLVSQRGIVGISNEPKLSARVTEAPFPLAAQEIEQKRLLWLG